ncbi:MAG: SRPBCC domain-containing protein [Solirubrobacteraceae bacterium]
MSDPAVWPDPVVRRERHLPADRDAVWALLRDADGLAGWLADEVDLEVREGAEGRLRWADGEERLAVVEEVADRRRIVLRWWEEDGPPSLVELTLDDAGDATRLVVVEVPVAALRVVGDRLPTVVAGPAEPRPTDLRSTHPAASMRAPACV